MKLDARKINIINWVSQYLMRKDYPVGKILVTRRLVWPTIHNEERIEIEECILQADRGKVKSNKEVFERYRSY